MAMSRSCALLIATFACGFMLSACDDSAPDPNESVSTTRAKPVVPKIPGLPPEMVAAVSGGKAATMISVHFALGSAPAVNQALPVEIAIVPHRAFTSIRASFETHDGLASTEGDKFGPKTDAPVEKPIQHRLVLMPNREGVFMVTAMVETEDQSGSETRIFSIPVIVGPATAAQGPPATSEPAATAAK
jgi:hypothetical protein